LLQIKSVSEEQLSNSEKLADLVVKGVQEKKAKNVVKMDLRGVDGAIADFFVVAQADSDRQVQAIAESVELEIKKATSELPYSKEGKQLGEWVLIDYVDVVAHIFQTEKREFFGIEELWADAKFTEYEDD
jgi:ribosome-associated protein